MNPFNDILLAIVEHLSGKLGFVTILIDKLVSLIAPNIVVQASCPPPNAFYCATVCGECCANCSGDYKSYVYTVYSFRPYCSGGTYRCVVLCDYC